VTALWIAVAVLALLLVLAAAGSFLLLAMGRMHLDLGWGRSLHQLGPIEVRIAAPRDMVFEMISAPYLCRAPGSDEIEVIAGDRSLVVAAHLTKVHFYEARTVEAVEFDPPARVGFRHLTGPVPHAVEEFILEADAEGTTLRYSGEVGIDFFLLGRLAGRYWVRGQWERAVSEHLEDLRRRAEERARRRRARESA
jgi:Polyketide cyclase / dehydrase and lipid transport